jgi:gluconate 5-dehydrogenase
VAPGLIETEASRGAWEDPERRAIYEAANCVGRLGLPEDLGWATLYLASPAAAFVTGTTLQVDGGLVVGTMAGDRKPSHRSR